MNASPARTGLSELIHGFLPGAGMIFLLACLAGLMTGPAGAAASMAPAEQSATGVHGFVIRLASTSRSFTANDADDLDIPAAHRVYITTFRKDGEVWQQLRVGFFAGKAEALAILKRIEPRFPGAQVTAVTSVDRKSSTVNLLASRPAAGKMPAQAVTDAAIPSPDVSSAPREAIRETAASLLGKIKRFSQASWFRGEPGHGRQNSGSSAFASGTASDETGHTDVTGKAFRDAPVMTGTVVAGNDKANRPSVRRQDGRPASAASAGSPASESTFHGGLDGFSQRSRFSKAGEGNKSAAPATRQGGLVRVAATSASAVSGQPAGFDHSNTGFVLEGAHAPADCSACHLQGVFKGTPKQCISCHSSGSRMSGQYIPSDHIKTMSLCEECHSSQQWTPLIRMNHDVVTGSCSSCHDGSRASGKPPGHISTGEDCETCHSTFSWIASAFDHGGVAPGTCFSCHNGATATGKRTNHVASSNACDDCHGTRAWIPARFDHNSVTGSCFSCHNGSTATGKTVTHISTSNTCEACHDINGWKPVLHPDHAEVTGTCFSCHNGSTASGKTPTHVASANTCDDCHNTASWTTVTFDHSGVTGSCFTCHNGTAAAGKNGTHM